MLVLLGPRAADVITACGSRFYCGLRLLILLWAMPLSDNTGDDVSMCCKVSQALDADSSVQYS